jgi:CrcB protein
MSRDVSTLAVVSIGGVLGALARYGLQSAFPSRPGGFDWATFAINVSGCLLIGIVVVFATESGRAHPLLRPFLATGVLGGFTTFSTYVVGIQRGLPAGAPRTALAYGAGTAIAALAAAWVGVRAATAASEASFASPGRGGPEGASRPGGSNGEVSEPENTAVIERYPRRDEGQERRS